MRDLRAVARAVLDNLGEDGVLPDLERCPCCGRGLHYVSGSSGVPGNHTRQVEVPDTPGVALYRECHACRARWHRYVEGHPLWEYAEPWVADWPASGRRPVADAWAEGVVRLPLKGHWVDARRTEDTGAETSDDPFGGPIYVLTAWNPNRRAGTWAANFVAQDRMHQVLRTRGVAFGEAASYDAALRWAEPAAAMSGISKASALDLARELEQPALQLLVGGRLTVLDSDTGQALVEPESVGFATVGWRGCPMRALAGKEQSADDCRNPGGPWVCASIHESARWRAQREMLLAALSCDVCAAGPAQGPGGRALYVSERVVASRYGRRRTYDRERQNCRWAPLPWQ